MAVASQEDLRLLELLAVLRFCLEKNIFPYCSTKVNRNTLYLVLGIAPVALGGGEHASGPLLNSPHFCTAESSLSSSVAAVEDEEVLATCWSCSNLTLWTATLVRSSWSMISELLSTLASLLIAPLDWPVQYALSKYPPHSLCFFVDVFASLPMH